MTAAARTPGALVNLALDLEIDFEIERQTPDTRRGLHVSDLIKGRGRTCARYVQLLLDPSTVFDVHPGAPALGGGRDMLVALAIQNLVLERALSAIVRGQPQLQILEFDVEQEVHHPSGICATPDLLLVYRAAGVSTRAVIDVKTVDADRFNSLRGKRGQRLVPTEYRRQVELYCGLLDAAWGAILWVVLHPSDARRFHLEQTLIPPSDAYVDEVLAWVDDAAEHLRSGEPAPAHVAKHCTHCRCRSACQRLGGGPPEEVDR